MKLFLSFLKSEFKTFLFFKIRDMTGGLKERWDWNLNDIGSKNLCGMGNENFWKVLHNAFQNNSLGSCSADVLSEIITKDHGKVFYKIYLNQ